MPWHCCPLAPAPPGLCSPPPQWTHLAELGAQPLGLGGVWPGQAGPQLLDVTEAEACSGCRAAVLGGHIHGLQLGRQEGRWGAAGEGGPDEPSTLMPRCSLTVSTSTAP